MKRRVSEADPKLTQSDLPYTMKLSDGRTLYVEVPGRMVERDRGGQPAFTPDGVRFLDHVRALAIPLTTTPRPAFITNLRRALGMTQAQLGEAVGVDAMTVSRWERGTMKPSTMTLKRIQTVVNRAKRRGVLLAG